MVVAHVVLTLDPGGQEYLVLQLAEQLERRGIRSPIIALSGGSLMTEAARRGLQVFDAAKSPGFTPRLFWTLSRLFRRLSATVVHTHNMGPLIYGTVAARALGLGTINTRHGRAALSTRRIVWALADRVVAVSEDARRELLAHNSVDPRKVSVVLNGVDVRAFAAPEADRAAVRAAVDIPNDARVFGIVARLAPEKAHATLLEAFALLIARGVPTYLVIVGGGPLEAALKAQAERLGIARFVRFLGFRTDIATLLRGVDVFVLSSLMEGISLTLLEAMAASLPVIATRVGGNPEVVKEGETGLLVSPGDSIGLADAMAALHADPSRARDYGSLGRERALRLFDLKPMVDAYVALYKTAERRVPRAARV